MSTKNQFDLMSEIIIDRVARHMGWEKWKATLWYQTPNPNFGGVSPLQLVKMERGHKVIQFIEYAEDEKKSFDALKEKYEREGITPPWQKETT